MVAGQVVVRRDGLRTRLDLNEWRRGLARRHIPHMSFGGVMEAVLVVVVVLPFWVLVAGCYELWERWK